MAVLAADAHTEDQATGRELVEVGELARHEDRMAQRQQVHAGHDGQRRVQHRQRRSLQDAVEAGPDEEAHVIAATHVVDAGVVHTSEIRRRVGGIPERPGRREDPDPE